MVVLVVNRSRLLFFLLMVFRFLSIRLHLVIVRISDFHIFFLLFSKDIHIRTNATTVRLLHIYLESFYIEEWQTTRGVRFQVLTRFDKRKTIRLLMVQCISQKRQIDVSIKVTLYAFKLSISTRYYSVNCRPNKKFIKFKLNISSEYTTEIVYLAPTVIRYRQFKS